MRGSSTTETTSASDTTDGTPVKEPETEELPVIGEDVRLVPALILEEDFEAHILKPLRDAVERGDITQLEYDRFLNSWFRRDLSQYPQSVVFELVNTKYLFLKKHETVNADGNLTYPVFYELKATIPSYRLEEFETLIETYTEYTREQMARDYAKVDYVPKATGATE